MVQFQAADLPTEGRKTAECKVPLPGQRPMISSPPFVPENRHHRSCPGGAEAESGEDGVDSGPPWTPASGLHH